jgi:hypothetical protein
VRWAHASYADFLAALALARRPVATLRAVILTRDPAGVFVAPHLRDLAVWLAELRPELLSDILPVDVVLALQGAALASDRMKGLTVDRWLDGIRTGSVHVPIGMFSHYAKVRHPGLAVQLTTAIQDRTRAVHERRIASDIAQACELVDLQDVWVRLACDPTEELDLRVAAADAIVHLGDTAAKRALLPLAQGTAGADPNDDLRGLGLLAVYPEVWGLSTVISHLPPPQLDNYFGFYEYFVADVLPSKVNVEDLPLLLHAAPGWLSRRVAFPSLIAKVMAAGWRQLDRNEIAESLARLLVARLQGDHEAFGDD